MIEVYVIMLQAFYGDCIYVIIEDGMHEFRMIMDGGVKATYLWKLKGRLVNGPLKTLIDNLKKEGKSIDLLLLSHIDNDHIGGFVDWMERDFPDATFISEFMFNDGEAIEIADKSCLDNSIGQAKSLKKLVGQHGFKYTSGILSGNKYEYWWGTMTVIAPTKTSYADIAKKWDYLNNAAANTNYSKTIKQLLEERLEYKEPSVENNSSIALLLSLKNDNILLLGDANIKDVSNQLKILGYSKDNKLNCSSVKLSHHGSMNNFTMDFLDMIDAKRFLVSTNGAKYGHPDKEVIARLVQYTDADIVFN